MKVYIAKESLIERFVRAKPEFFSKVLEVDEKLGKALLEFEDKVRTYREWVRKMEAALATNNADAAAAAIKETPIWQEEAPAEEPPKKQASGQRSSKKSPAKRKKKASSSSTSQKKAE